MSLKVRVSLGGLNVLYLYIVKIRKNIGLVAAVLWPLFQIYTATTTPLPALMQRSIHLAFACAVLFLLIPEEKQGVKNEIINFIFAVASLAGLLYMAHNHLDICMRVGKPLMTDIILGVITIIIVIEGTRRVIGPFLPILCIISILYAYFGNLMPRLFWNVGFGTRRIISILYLTTDGIFGIALAVSATFVAIFIIFGGLLKDFGGGEFFINIASALVGKNVGGAAKASVVASALFGTISGSTMANIVTTGAFTIPLMKKTGFSADFAGAVEAVASTGGMILPPVMGAAAFIMAEIIGIPYWEVCKVAFFPAFLYYLSIFFSIHFRAASKGLHGMPHSQIPSLRKVLKDGWPFLSILFVLVWMLAVLRVTPLKAGVMAIWATVILSLLKQSSRVKWKHIVSILEGISRGLIVIAFSTAACGIIIGVVNLTGIGMQLSMIMVSITGGNLFFLLLLTTLAAFIFGMAGLITPAYVILAIMVAPTLVHAGVDIKAAHLFIIHYVAFADITPPVAIGAFIAAGIAGGNGFRTGMQAIMIALPSFIVPFLFVYRPQLMLVGNLGDILISVIIACTGIIFFAAVMQGYFFEHLSFLNRIYLFICVILLLIPYPIVPFLGVLGCALFLLQQCISKKNKLNSV